MAVEKILGLEVLYFGVCCILINVRMNKDEGKFVLVKEIFRWTHLFLNWFLSEFKATQFSLLFFWIYFFNLFCLFFCLCFGECVDMNSLSVSVHIHTSLV